MSPCHPAPMSGTPAGQVVRHPSKERRRQGPGRLVRVALVAGLALAAAAAPAAIVSLGAGDSALYAFDYSAQTPPPPYTQAVISNGQFSIDLDSVQAGEFVNLDFYDAIDGGGAPLATLRFGASSGLTISFSQSMFVDLAGVLDGEFSARVRAEGGAFDLVSVVASMCDATRGCTQRIDGALVRVDLAAPVPEPGSLACAVLALGALAGRGRRRAQEAQPAPR